jgi:hypothetical protein
MRVQNAVPLPFRVHPFLSLLQHCIEALAGIDSQEMRWAKHGFTDRQRALVQDSRFWCPALGMPQACEVMQNASRFKILGPELLLVDAQCSLVERFC